MAIGLITNIVKVINAYNNKSAFVKHAVKVSVDVKKFGLTQEDI